MKTPLQRKASWLMPAPLFYLLVSSLIYFSPYVLSSFDFIRDSISSRINTSYDQETGLVVLFALVSILIGMFLYPSKQVNFSTKKQVNFESIALTILLLGTGAYTLLTPELYLANKSDVLGSTNRIHLLFYSLCSLGVLFSVLSNWKNQLVVLMLSGGGLLLILYIGHRSAIAITVLSLSYLVFRNIPVRKIPIRYFLMAIGILIFLAAYKSIYIAVKLGAFDLARERLLNGGFIEAALIGLEQFVIFLHLDYVVSNDYTPECSNLWLIPVSLIPFSNLVFDGSACTFTDQIKPMFFEQFSGGVGANIWAEFFANFGYIGIPMLVLTIGLITLTIERVINRISSPALTAGLIVSIMHFTFYIQRKELLGAFISGKRVIIAALLVFIAGFIIKEITSKRLIHFDYPAFFR